MIIFILYQVSSRVSNLEYLSSIEGDGPLPWELEEDHHDEDDQEGLQHRSLEQLVEFELQVVHPHVVQIGVKMVHCRHFVAMARQNTLFS